MLKACLCMYMSPSMPLRPCHLLFDILFIFGSRRIYRFTCTQIEYSCPWECGSFEWLNCWLAGWLARWLISNIYVYMRICTQIACVCACVWKSVFILRQTELTICHFHQTWYTLNSAILYMYMKSLVYQWFLHAHNPTFHILYTYMYYYYGLYPYTNMDICTDTYIRVSSVYWSNNELNKIQL